MEFQKAIALNAAKQAHMEKIYGIIWRSMLISGHINRDLCIHPKLKRKNMMFVSDIREPGPPFTHPSMIQHRLNLVRDPIEILPWRPLAVVRPKPETKPIVRVAWDHVQVNVEHLLACGSPVRQEKVDAIAPESTAPHRPCDALGHFE